jgi:hypothetical protein
MGQGRGDQLETARSTTVRAVEDHGRGVTTTPQAAAWYRRAQWTTDCRLAIAALRLAVKMDPSFGIAVADLDAITEAPPGRSRGVLMNWERHHIEVVAAAATGNARRASDLLREHLASVGCDPLAFRITAMLRQPTGNNDDFENLVRQLPGCHTTPWPRSP